MNNFKLVFLGVFVIKSDFFPIQKKEMPQNFCTKIESSGRSEALKILFLCMEKILPYFANSDFEKKERVCQKYGLVKIKQL